MEKHHIKTLKDFRMAGLNLDQEFTWELYYTCRKLYEAILWEKVRDTKFVPIPEDLRIMRGLNGLRLISKSMNFCMYMEGIRPKQLFFIVSAKTDCTGRNMGFSEFRKMIKTMKEAVK